MEEIRLNKYLSACGICSRREADRLVGEGRVTIDGRIAAMGEKVLSGQSIYIDGKKIIDGSQKAKAAPVLLAVNKPRGIVCTTSDKDRAVNIVEYLHYPSRIYCVGRLDKDSEGLLLMTNQGDLVNKMMRSGNAHEKEYFVTVDKAVTAEFIKAMGSGVPILDTVTRTCDVRAEGKQAFTIILTQGLNRQIRRMCEYLGYQVVTLKRVRIMNLRLGKLKTGEYREVSLEEYKELLELLKDSSNLPLKETKNGRKNS